MNEEAKTKIKEIIVLTRQLDVIQSRLSELLGCDYESEFFAEVTLVVDRESKEKVVRKKEGGPRKCSVCGKTGHRSDSCSIIEVGNQREAIKALLEQGIEDHQEIQERLIKKFPRLTTQRIYQIKTQIKKDLWPKQQPEIEIADDEPKENSKSAADEIREAHASGLSVEDIAYQFGVGEKVVESIISKKLSPKIEIKEEEMWPEKELDPTRAKIKEMRDNGFNSEEISKDLGLPIGYVNELIGSLV